MKFALIVLVCYGLIELGAATGEQRVVVRRVAVSAQNPEGFANFGKRSVSNAAPASVNPSKQASEVEPLASAPSSWQLMSAIEAPAASSRSDLSAASSDDSAALNEGDFLRSPSKTNRQQTSTFFQPPKQRLVSQGKTSNFQASKTSWYQPPPTPPSPPRPAPIVQEQFEQQQNEQYTEQQQVESAPPGQAEPFAFDFNTRDQSGNGQYRKEASDNDGVVRGSYGFRDASGIYRHVDYVADQNGFRANIKSNEPGVEAGPKSQPASIRLEGGASGQQSQRSSLPAGSNDNSEWSAATASTDERANLALAPPNFESSHKPERIRSPRQF